MLERGNAALDAARPDTVAGPAAGRALLAVDDLHVHFLTPLGVARAVNGVSFTLEHGRTLGIVGESGSGKSVLSRAIIDILAKDGSVVRQGTVSFDGRDLGALSERAMRAMRGREIAMIFQDPMSSLNPVKKIGVQITEVLEKHLRMDRRAARRRAAELIASVGIPDAERQLDRLPIHLSGGMRQRVAIAIALAGEPRLLIADEPTTSLDVTIQTQILDLLRRVQRERNMSMILITHNLGVVAGYTDDVIVMYGGRIVEQATTRELLAAPLMPYAEGLMRSAPRLTDPPHTRLKAIPGMPPNVLDAPSGCCFHVRCDRQRDRCGAEAPPLVARGARRYACWYPLDGTDPAS